MDWAEFDWQPCGDEFRAWDGEKFIYRTNYDALYGDDEYYDDDDDYEEEEDFDADYGDVVYFGFDDDEDDENPAPSDDTSDIPF